MNGSDSDNASGEVSGSGEYSSSGSDIISDSYSGIMSFGGTTGMFSGGDTESDSSSGSEDFELGPSGNWTADDGGTEESSSSASSTETYSGSYSSGGDSATYSFTISDSVSASDEEMTEGGGWVDESNDVSGSDSDTETSAATQTGSYVTAYGIVGSFTNTEGDSSQDQDGWSDDMSDGTTTDSGSGSGSDTSTDSYSDTASGSYTAGNQTGTYSESFSGGDSDKNTEMVTREPEGIWEANGSDSGSGSSSATISDSWKSVVISATSGGYETTLTTGTGGGQYSDSYTESDTLTDDVWGTASGSGSGSGSDSESTSSTTTGTYQYTFDSGAGTVYGTITGSGNGNEQDSYQDNFTLGDDGWTTSETGSGSASSTDSQSTVGTGTYTIGPAGTSTALWYGDETVTTVSGSTTIGTLSDSGNTSSNSQTSFSWDDDGWTESTQSSGSGSSMRTYSYTLSGSTTITYVTPGDPVTSTITTVDNPNDKSANYQTSQTTFGSSETSSADGSWNTSGSTSTSSMSTNSYSSADTQMIQWVSSWPAGEGGASTSGSTYLEDDYWVQSSGSGQSSAKLGTSNSASSDGSSESDSWGSGASSWSTQTTWQSSVVGTGFDKEYGLPGSSSDSGGGPFSYGSSGSGSGSGSGSSEQDAGASSGSGSGSSGGSQSGAPSDESIMSACFAPGTPIRIPGGWKKIEEISEGDFVLARDESLPGGEVLIRRVEAVFVRQGMKCELWINSRLIVTTPEHPFHVQGVGWVPAGALAAGMKLDSLDGPVVTVNRVRPTVDSITVHNMRVAESHTYFVGEDSWGWSVWAHNTDYNNGVTGGWLDSWWYSLFGSGNTGQSGQKLKEGGAVQNLDAMGNLSAGDSVPPAEANVAAGVGVIYAAALIIEAFGATAIVVGVPGPEDLAVTAAIEALQTKAGQMGLKLVVDAGATGLRAGQQAFKLVSDTGEALVGAEAKRAVRALKSTYDEALQAARNAFPKRITSSKHHPNSLSPEPPNAQQLFDSSIVDKNGVRWAKDSDGTIHRFSKPSNGESHWNGSTSGVDPILPNNIPNGIRKLLK